MLGTTVLDPTKYLIAQVSDWRVTTLIISPRVICEDSVGYDQTVLTSKENVILSTYGRYADESISLKKALLLEREAERNREDKKFH